MYSNDELLVPESQEEVTTFMFSHTLKINNNQPAAMAKLTIYTYFPKKKDVFIEEVFKKVINYTTLDNNLYLFHNSASLCTGHRDVVII